MSKYITVKCSEKQKKMIEKNAKQCSKSVSAYMLSLAQKDNHEDSPAQMLKKLGVTNWKKIITCEKLYENSCEKAYKITTDLGEVVFRILDLKDGRYSKLDYCSTNYKFKRNSNSLNKYK